MAQFNKLLFPTDFSVCAEHAQEYAFALAKNVSASIHVVHVVDRAFQNYMGLEASPAAFDRTLEAIDEHARTHVAKIIDAAANEGIEATSYLERGRPDLEIAALASGLQCDLIIIGTHGRSGFEKLFFGSVCEKVVRTSPVPVLAIKHPEHDFVKAGAPISLKRVLCPCDFSDISRSALPMAASLCRDFGATLVLTHVIDTRLDYPEFMPGMDQLNSPELRKTTLQSLKEIAAEMEGLETEITVATGRPHREVAEMVETEKIDLIVMATHGRSGLAHAFLGSTTEKVVRLAPCPVLTMRPDEAALAAATQSEAAKAQQDDS